MLSLVGVGDAAGCGVGAAATGGDGAGACGCIATFEHAHTSDMKATSAT